MDSYSEQAQAREEAGAGAFSLADAVAVIRRRCKLIVVLSCLIAAAAALLAVLLPNQYEAVSTVLIDARKKTVVQVGKVVEGIRVNTPAVESQVEIVASKGVALAVIENLNLRHDLEFAGDAAAAAAAAAATSLARASARIINDLPRRRALARDTTLAAFQSRLRVRRVRNTHLIEIAFTAGSALKAATIANAIAQTYVARELAQKIRDGEIATNFLARKLDALRARVTAGEHKVEQFKAANNIFDAEGQILSEKRLARLMEQTVVARNNTAQAKSKYDQIQKLVRAGHATGAIADVLESHTVRMLKDQQAKLTGHVAELTIKYGHLHPAMKKARAEVRDIAAQLKAEVDRIVFNQKNEYDVALARERDLAANLVVLKNREIAMKRQSVTLKELKRQAGTSAELYEAILSRYKQTAETQAMQFPDSRLAEAAAVPLQPSSPKRMQLVVVGSLAGIGLALGLAFALEFMAGGLARADEFEQVPALEQIAALPRLDDHGGLGIDPLSAKRQMIVAPQGAFAEAMRGVRLALDTHRAMAAPGSGGNAPTIILVVSALPGEGRSIVASNLAHHYAMTGTLALLIDADMRRAGLTADLAPSARAGLLDCLAAGVPPHLTILRDAGTGLNFLPARAGTPPRISASEALCASQTASTLQKLKSSFDAVIIDCPPLLPVIDARILARQADQILFVMTARRTPKELAKRAVRLLGPDAQKIVGVVVNQVEPVADAEGSAGALDGSGNGRAGYRRAA